MKKRNRDTTQLKTRTKNCGFPPNPGAVDTLTSLGQLASDPEIKPMWAASCNPKFPEPQMPKLAERQGDSFVSEVQGGGLRASGFIGDVTANPKP